MSRARCLVFLIFLSMTNHLTPDGSLKRCVANIACPFGFHGTKSEVEAHARTQRKDKVKGKNGLFKVDGVWFKANGQPLTKPKRPKSHGANYERDRKRAQRKKAAAQRVKDLEAAGYKPIYKRRQDQYAKEIQSRMIAKGYCSKKKPFEVKFADLAGGVGQVRRFENGKRISPVVEFDWWLPPGGSVDSVWDGFMEWFLENGKNGTGWLEEAFEEGAKA